MKDAYSIAQTTKGVLNVLGRTLLVCLVAGRHAVESEVSGQQ